MSASQRLWRILRARLSAGYRELAAAGHAAADPAWADPAWAPSPSTAPPRREIDPLLARYYANLEIPYGSDLETVDRAWKRLLRKYHPDRHATDPERQRLANDLVKELNRAREHLRRKLEN